MCALDAVMRKYSKTASLVSAVFFYDQLSVVAKRDAKNKKGTTPAEYRDTCPDSVIRAVLIRRSVFPDDPQAFS